MSESILAKVVLMPDASVHICTPTQGIRTFYGTAANLRAVMSDGLYFLSNDIEGECESTEELFGTNRKNYPPFGKCPGVVLCYLNNNKELVCKFPELLQVMFNSMDANRENERLNMRSFIFDSGLTDSKAFLLRYYLTFVDEYSHGTKKMREFSLGEEAFFSVLREIFNTVFSFKPTAPPKKDLEARINDAQYKQAFEDPSTGNNSDMVPITEYCAIHGINSRNEVYSMLNRGLLTRVEKRGNKFYLDKNEKPVRLVEKLPDEQPPRVPEEERPEFLFRNDEDWPAKKVENFIVGNRLYSSLVAKSIYTKQELDIYLEYGFRETEYFNLRFLILPFDVDLCDENGKSNRERMLGGHPPVAIDPNNPSSPPKAVELHHMGQMYSSCFATVPFHLHKKYQSIFHCSEPSKDNHDAFFEKTKEQFWVQYIRDGEKNGKFDFDNIEYIYPPKKRKKG